MVLGRICALIALAIGAVPPLAAQQAADLVLLGGRIFTADPLEPWAEAVPIRDGRAMLTIVGGRVVHRSEN